MKKKDTEKTQLPELPKLRALIEELTENKTSKEGTGEARVRNAIDLCEEIPDMRVRAALINILTQSLFEDENAAPYQDIPKNNFQGAQQYWDDRKKGNSLLVLPRNIFLTDVELCRLYLDDILPAEKHAEMRANIVQALRTADYHMYMLTQYTQFALRSYTIRCAVTELSSVIEGILVAFATDAGGVPVTPYDLDLSAEELSFISGRDFFWGEAPDRVLYERRRRRDPHGGTVSWTVPVNLDDLKLGSFIQTRTARQLELLEEKSDITYDFDNRKIKKALKDKQLIKLIDFNHDLYWHGNTILTTSLHLNRENEEITDFRGWLDEVRLLRNNIHLAAIDGTVAQSPDYSSLETVTWLYDFLHVTVEALKLYVAEQQ